MKTIFYYTAMILVSSCATNSLNYEGCYVIEKKATKSMTGGYSVKNSLFISEDKFEINWRTYQSKAEMKNDHPTFQTIKTGIVKNTNSDTLVLESEDERIYLFLIRKNSLEYLPKWLFEEPSVSIERSDIWKKRDSLCPE